MKKAMTRILCVLLAGVLFAMAQVVPAAAANEPAADTAVAAKLTGKTAGVMTGTPQDEIVKQTVPDAEILYFNSMTDILLALQSKKIDYFVLSTVNYCFMAQDCPDLGYLDCTLKTYDIGAIFPKTQKGEDLRAEYNAYLREITNSGELKRLQEYWLEPNDWENIDIPSSGEKGTLRMTTTNTLKPFSMELNGQNAGLDIAIAAGFCKANGYGLEIENTDFAGGLSGIASGVYDLAAGQIAYTQERAQSVLYSDFYYTQTIVPIVRASDFEADEVICDTAIGKADDSGQDGENPVLTGIRRTLVDQDRWKSILAGLGTTLIITFAGFALANVLGALLCAAALSRSRAARAFARVYSGLAQGLPVVVVLMVLYYIVFAGLKANNVLVASVGFGLVFAAYLEQLFEGAIRGVDAGQREAGLASGLTARQTFLGIVLPQAARTSITGYFSNLINLMKGTAVVGYIAVADLTKAGDVIRSATYDAYVPILTVTAIYLLMTGIFIACMSLVKRAFAGSRTRKAGEAA